MDGKQRKRYTSFIDILGFQNSILNIEKEPESYKKIADTLTNISTINELRKIVRSDKDDPTALQHFEATQDLRIQAFSDCILISSNDNQLGLVAVTAMSALTYWILFSHGFYARGAITKDLLTHNEGVVFGKALVRAYSLEQKVSIFPRIILSQETYNDLTSNNKLRISTKTDFDGQPFLDVFDSKAIRFINTWNERQPNLQAHINLTNGRKELEKHFQQENDVSVRQKLTWLKNYFNSSAAHLELEEI